MPVSLAAEAEGDAVAAAVGAVEVTEALEVLAEEASGASVEVAEAEASAVRQAEEAGAAEAEAAGAIRKKALNIRIILLPFDIAKA